MITNDINQVSIVDIKMPFWSIVVFMGQAALASIPAIIILAIIYAICGAIFGGILVGLGLAPF